MDRNGTLARIASPVINWASDKSNKPMRAVMEKVAGIDRKANLPKFHSRTFVSADKADPIEPNQAAPAYGKRKAALYATCFVNYNKPVTGMAARAVLNHIGVETKAAYPGCCGMPFLEQAELARVARECRQGVEGIGQADRRGLRHRRPHRLLRLDAEIRMGADLSRQSRTSNASPTPPSTLTNMSWTSPRRRACRMA